MGCDIHLVLEKRDEDNDCWVGVRNYVYSPPSLFNNVKTDWSFVSYTIKGRNYDFFNDLAGVRGPGSTFGYQPKGLPDDMSSLTRMRFANDDDMHSHSWLTMAELRPVLQKHFVATQMKARLTDQSMDDDPVRAFVDPDIGDDYNDKALYRLVFCFDN